jgi:hypothetical protein
LLGREDVGVVIIDDTNLNPDIIEGWRNIARAAQAQCEIITMNTPMEACIRRDQDRERSVGAHIIVGMALQYDLYPHGEKGIVLCDIDGTIADISHRLHFVRGHEHPKDWDRFFAHMFSDTVRHDTYLALQMLQRDGYDIFFVSGRPDTYRDITEEWLAYHCANIDWQAVFMRRGGDRRPDDIVKEEILNTYFKSHLSRILCVYDDRPSVIRMWERYGLHVINCGNGEEF